ncbi:MAG: GspE/PulE family protein [Planctomycetota bacterium]|jgi:general secretion pathway protein E
MQILAFIEYFPTSSPLSAGSHAVLLPFNPIKLVLLVGWVYVCLYFVQRVQFSPLVPRRHKSIANIVTLFTGPILLFVLVVVDAARKSSESGRSIFAIIGQRLRNAVASVSPSGLISSKDDSKIRLLDSSGRGIKEIYGHGRSRREDEHVLNLTEQTIFDALEEQASDILIDPKDGVVYTVRFRIDGVLRTVDEVDSGMAQAVINSIKAVSSMDISERRRPQDGAFTAKTREATVSFRVASAGAIHGEKLSVRILGQMAGRFALADIGLTEKQRLVIENAIGKPSGMVLVVGPTGSGKTTTLYAMLNEIDFFTRNVITVEDPIECVLPNASQIEINPKADITFAKSLRSILRQDPDVICVGEIRDEETAATALRASQTGHLVLATIHSDTNASAVVRLLDLGVTPLLLSSGLNVMAAQRLLRRLCDNCKRPAELSPSQISEFRRKGVNYKGIFQAGGCEQCYGTGYHGRIAIFDIMVLDARLKTRIANNELSPAVLKEGGDKKGKSSLFKHGLKNVVSGITSLEELKRVVG